MTACEWCGGEETAGVCPRSLACPQCAAVPGSSCRRPSGHRAATLHAGRIHAAEALDALEAPGLEEHAGGQLRISAQGDQLSIVPLEDAGIPSQPVDTEAAREQERRQLLTPLGGYPDPGPPAAATFEDWQKRHGCTLEIGQHVENIHPYNRGRYPIGVVIGGGFGGGQVTVQVGSGSTVYGPAAHWQPTDRRPDWLPETAEMVAYREGIAELELHAICTRP